MRDPLSDIESSLWDPLDGPNPMRYVTPMYIQGRCGICDFPTDRLPCPWCTLREITEVDGDGKPIHSQVDMYQLAADTLGGDKT